MATEILSWSGAVLEDFATMVGRCADSREPQLGMGGVRQQRSDPAGRLAVAAARCRRRQREANGVCCHFCLPGARGGRGRAYRVRRGLLVLCPLLRWS